MMTTSTMFTTPANMHVSQNLTMKDFQDYATS